MDGCNQFLLSVYNKNCSGDNLFWHHFGVDYICILENPLCANSFFPSGMELLVLDTHLTHNAGVQALSHVLSYICSYFVYLLNNALEILDRRPRGKSNYRVTMREAKACSKIRRTITVLISWIHIIFSLNYTIRK